ncbi:alpha beta-hydrolase [Hymenopellis radicata]|nr:alpha beta-hydrolase [Hymenopellis radicata]
MSSEKPFQISVSDDKIDLLRRPGSSYGVPLAAMRRLVDYWKSVHRDIQVDGFETLNIHYVHQKSKAVDAIPLLFLHGWPSSFLEVRKILPLLTATDAGHPSFHVVALSLPGFGFSQAPSKKGFRVNQYAEVAHKVMLALGYNEYVTQGGDLGTMITRAMALKYGGKHVKAWHTTLPYGFPPPPTRPIAFLQHLLTPYTAAEKAGAQKAQWFEKQGSGYFLQQSTQPQTLGYSLADSPVGLLAWVYEKLLVWTDEYPWTDDEVLTWISVYLFSKSWTYRVYANLLRDVSTRGHLRAPAPEFWFRKRARLKELPAKDQEAAREAEISIFPADMGVRPISWFTTNGNLVFSNNTHTKGGHFGAWEAPDGLVGDLRRMFGKGGPAFSVVPGRKGY